MSSDIELVTDEGAKADAARFFEAGLHLISLLDSLTDETDVAWEVTDLRLGSAVSALAATGTHAADGHTAATRAVVGLQQIRAGQGSPQGWTPDAIKHASDLARVAGERASIKADDAVIRLDERLRERLTQATPRRREFYGAIRGTLTGMNVTRGNRASLRPQTGGPIVRVTFHRAMEEEMKDALLQPVEVEGWVHQDGDGINFRIDALEIRVMRATSMRWTDLWSALPDITEGMPPRQYLEEVVRGQAD